VAPWFARAAGANLHDMNTMNRIRRALAALPAETRPAFQRVDASRAKYDDGAWLKNS
jgi:hypothetical protein